MLTNNVNIQFYDVKNRKKISVPIEKVKKTKYPQGTRKGSNNRYVYAIRAEIDERKLTKFVSRSDWESLSAPEESSETKLRR
jgi:hypothetical protein